MLHSAEIRWFHQGLLPLPTVQWFCDGQSLSMEERTDHYLVFPGCESVGVKIREESFEIKALKGMPDSVQFPAGVSGRVECWIERAQLKIDRNNA